MTALSGYRVGCPACRKPFTRCTCDKWCEECGITTNHDTVQHQERMAEMEGREP